MKEGPGVLRAAAGFSPVVRVPSAGGLVGRVKEALEGWVKREGIQAVCEAKEQGPAARSHSHSEPDGEQVWVLRWFWSGYCWGHSGKG